MDEHVGEASAMMIAVVEFYAQYPQNLQPNDKIIPFKGAPIPSQVTKNVWMQNVRECLASGVFVIWVHSKLDSFGD